MSILVLNAGSSSIKFSAVRRRRRRSATAAARPDRRPVHVAALHREGCRRRRRSARKSWGDGAKLGHEGAHRPTWPTSCAATGRAMQLLAVGHRVVHGGMEFTRPVQVTPAGDRRRSAKLTPLAPLHQPHNLEADRRSSPSCGPTCRRWPASTPRSTARSPRWRRPSRCRRRSPTRACGATASTACPTSTSPARCRRSTRAPRPAARSSRTSATAAACARWSAGRSVASTMGFTAVDGLPMGTRCGSLDPGVILYLMDELGMDARAIEKLIYQQSGLLGVSGLSSDMRDAADERRSARAARGRSVSSTASRASSARSRRRRRASMRWCSPPASASTRR